MNVKLPLFICFLYSSVAFSQGKYATTGLFTYLDSLHIPTTYEIGPGQLTKDGSAFILGLLDGELDDYVNLYSNLYAYNIKSTDTIGELHSLGLPNRTDSVRYFQCSVSDDNQVIVYVVNAFAGWNDNELGIATKQPDGSYKEARMLTELNDPIQSDAYPWISGDGLRVYYTRNFKIMYAERNSLTAVFSSPVEVTFSGEVQLELLSCWLAPDEKTIFLIANNVIYYASRRSTKEPFSLPELFTKEFKNFYFISGLSFMPDKRTMYLYHSTEDSQIILTYKLTNGKAW